MASIIPGYNYDIFISYRQKDNKGDRWVSEFVDALKDELESTFKEEISVYFDINPHDGLLDTHDVNASLKDKLKCLVFIPIISRTYCDPKSFAWEHEFKAFVDQASGDQYGLKVKLPGGNVASRILPVRIHDLDNDDIKLCESVLKSVLRGIEFIYKEQGVNRSLSPKDHEEKNLNNTNYRNQINKVALAIKEIVSGLKTETVIQLEEKAQHTEPLEKGKKEERNKEQDKPEELKKSRLLYGIISAAILVIAALLVYPRILKKDRFEAIRDPDGRISIAVLPFENLTGDTTLNFFQRGISSLIINNLGSSSELAVRDDQTMIEVMEGMDRVFTAGISPSIAKEVAEKVRAETYISGSYQGVGGLYWILLNLIDTKSGDIIWTNKVEGDLKSSGYLALVDSLCNEIKDYLEIKVLEQQADYDFREAYPESAEAYRYFIEGVNLILEQDYRSAITSLKKAVDIDSMFTFASFYIAFAYNFGRLDQTGEETNRWILKAYNTKERLPLKYQYWLELWYACGISENPKDIARYCDLLEKSDIDSRLVLLDLGVTYDNMLHQYEKAIRAFKRIEEINIERGVNWKYDRYYIDYCESLLMAGRPEEVQRVAELGLRVNPDNDSMIDFKCSSGIMMGDSAAAEKSISELIRWYEPRYTLPESTWEWGIGYLYLWGKDTITAEKHWRKAYNLDPHRLARINNLCWILIRPGINVEEGLQLSQKGLLEFPESKYLLWMKGLALHKSGKHEEALDILKEVDKKYTGYNIELCEDILEAEKAVASLKNN